ncbi:MAG: class I SAM-dependent methyltransferase [Myxococcales bacterium]|nr:class I SAM-dependent methyltransferase [Myxococcales bacterium]
MTRAPSPAALGRRVLRRWERFHHRTVHLPRVGRVAEALAALVGTAESVCDVGCGDGTIAARVAAAVGATRVVGVDVALREAVAIEAAAYDGRRLPFADASFEVVLASDVLHHAADPGALLAECLRVARRAVALKDHLSFGPVSERLLWLMDVSGNAAPGVLVRGRYLGLEQWLELVAGAGGRLRRITWPLRIHDLPWRLVTRSELQFAALVEHAALRRAPEGG